MGDILSSILKKCSKKDLEEKLADAKKMGGFAGGYRQSAITRELRRRESIRKKK